MRLHLSLIVSLAIYSSNTLAATDRAQTEPSCQSSRVKLQILGSRGPEILDRQASTGYLIWLDGKARVIVDAGPGSLQRFEQSGAKFEDVDLMLFSHFHADHSSDFPAYIKGSFFTDRVKDLLVFGPTGSSFVASAEEFVNRAIGREAGMYPYLGSYLAKDMRSAYKVVPKNIEWSETNINIRNVYHDAELSVRTVSTHHGPFPSLGYRVELAGCSISFTGDMSGQLGVMPKLAINSDILVAHNVIPEDMTGVAANLHMKPNYIGKMAQQAKVKQVLLTHLMARSIRVKPNSLEIIKKKYQGKVTFANDLDIFNP